MQYVKINGIWMPADKFYKKTSGAWSEIGSDVFVSYIQNRVLYKKKLIGFMKIIGPESVVSESCIFRSVYNNVYNVTDQSEWYVVSGDTFGSISGGVLTINTGANNSNIIIKSVFNGVEDFKSITATYSSGKTTNTEVNTTTDVSGNVITEISVITENSDGSFNSTSTNYDEDGNALNTVNESGDTIGNVSIQEVDYDESGNSVVVGYEIDTTASSGAGKSFLGDGVNTEFIPFADDNCGFICHIKFETERTEQPRPPIVEDTEDTGTNWLYNIMGAKSATQLPTGGWPGFDIRWTLSKSQGTGKIQFRYTQSGSTTTASKDLTGKNEDGTASGNTYDLTITYDPELVLPTSRTKFSVTSANGCIQSIGTNIVFASNNIDFTLGYALNMQGEPYRYSNVKILDFSITKICSAQLIIPSEPEISCDGQLVTITCDTEDARIYYRLGQTGSYLIYSSPIEITGDTIVQAYSELMGLTSDVAQEYCVYVDEIEDPVIHCDGEYVTIVSETPSVNIYYRLNQIGEYQEYIDAIQISADTIVQAYAELYGNVSNTVSANCIYDNSIKQPVITCVNNEVTITCSTQGADIYYKLDQAGTYALYSGPITISADTVVWAYSELNGDESDQVSELCIYEDYHDYSLDYLTFNVISAGTISWKALGTGHTDEIQYSLNGGAWTSITATTGGTMIQVSAGDKVRFKGTNTTYAKDKSNYAGFEGGTALFDIEGNILSLLYGDNFTSTTALTGTYTFCSIFKKSKVISAENLILPSTVLTNYCYRAMFSYCESLIVAPKLPATTLSQGCYWYMFERAAISVAPELNATVLVRECYGNMFNGCSNLNYIKCLATTSLSAVSALTNWVASVSSTGTFVKDSNTVWSRGNSGIPTNWNVCDDEPLFAPSISFDGDEIELSCETVGASIYYKLNQTGDYSLYTSPISVSADTLVEAYSELGANRTIVVSQDCEHISDIPLEASNRNLTTWKYNGQEIETPYSVNAINGHSSSYSKGTFSFDTILNLREAQPTHLWFQHADQSADIYVDNVKVETHWGGYNAFFSDITNYIHKGTNNIKVSLCNTTRNELAPAAGDFNFNATLGNVKVLTSPVLPDVTYGYDGFHVTSDVSSSSATINVTTTVPSGASVTCIIDDGTYYASGSQISDGTEMEFTDVIQNPHLWNGTLDPHLYTITLEIYHEGDLYHRFQRPYGLRYYEYVINETISGNTYTGFLLNGSPYLLRGVCMHDDLDGKANALTSSDYAQEFSIIQELGCNFLRLAHYPHPKEVYDWCDQLGIIVQTEVPCVNKLQSTMPADYYTHLEGQYRDMVNQHYNHPCIVFWGLSNETTTDDKEFGKTKIEQYTSLIKSLDSERLVGYVMSHSYSNPSSYYNNPNVDWFGANIYVGWYIDKASNDPTSQLNTRVKNIITNTHKALAFSEYGCGGTQHCHSDDPQTTTTKGNYERHDIEYQMWLHEGHIAAIRNFPQLLFTAEWQLFDIAVSNRNEGYTICLDGETTSVDDNLRRLNDKGLVERDHVTKKDTFYIYKAEWSTQSFVHICGKDYTKKTDRVIKCYTNDGNSLSLYVNNTFIETVDVTDHIALFTARTFSSGDIIRVDGLNTSDTFTF